MAEGTKTSTCGWISGLVSAPPPGWLDDALEESEGAELVAGWVDVRPTGSAAATDCEMARMTTQVLSRRWNRDTLRPSRVTFAE
jgi:hypothetical protein